jgi:hypothetical protein
MTIRSRRVLAIAVSIGALLTASLAGALAPTPIELRITEELAPPGGIAQVKLEVTEPKPISTGRMFMQFDGFDDFAGIAALSPNNDAYGVAQIRDSGIRFVINSPSAGAGTDSDYPILTIAARVPATAPLGSVLPVAIAGNAIRITGPNGVLYASSVKDGSVTVARGISIDNIIPGSAAVPAGGVVTIVGRGFQPSTRVRFGEVSVAAVRYIDPTHMQVVLKSAARMHGVRVRAENRDGSRTEYFSYQRTQRQGTSAFASLNETVPLFPLRLTTAARLDVASIPTALALQNITNTTASVRLDLLSSSGQVLDTASTSIASNRFRLRDVSEWFGTTYATPSSVRIRSNIPIQVLGVRVDAAGDATAFSPR